MNRIPILRSPKAFGEAEKGFDRRLEDGFWDRFVRPGLVVDVGYRGSRPDAEPLFLDAIGLDIGTPGYNCHDLPFAQGEVGTVHASHLLEHVVDYGHFLRECVRVLRPGGTLILTVPLMEAYEGQTHPPSLFNHDHKRFYTAGRLCFEIESSLPRGQYRIVHLQELFNTADLGRPVGVHAIGPLYEIECVVEKTIDGAVYA